MKMIDGMRLLSHARSRDLKSDDNLNTLPIQLHLRSDQTRIVAHAQYYWVMRWQPDYRPLKKWAHVLSSATPNAALRKKAARAVPSPGALKRKLLSQPISFAEVIREVSCERGV